MKVSTRLATGFGLLIFVLIAVVANHLTVIHQVSSANRNLSEISHRLTLSSTQQVKELDDLEDALKKYLVTADPRYADALETAERGFQATLDRLEAAPLTETERAGLAQLVEAWVAFVAVTVPDTDGAPTLPEPGVESTFETLDRDLASLRARVRRVNRATQSAIAAEVNRSARAARAAQRVSLTALGIAFVICVLISFRIVRSITGPLGRLTAATEALGRGDFAHRVRVSQDNEFSQLAQGFNLMAQRLDEQDRMKKDLFSHVSHELKTPLASMQEANQLLLDGLPGALADSQKRLLELNVRNGRRLSDMITKLLDLSKIEAGFTGYDLSEHDLVDLVRQAVRDFRRQSPEPERAILEDYAERRVLVRCDGVRIMQIVHNLLDNALKFSRETPIRVWVESVTEIPSSMPRNWLEAVHSPSQTGYALLRVSDEGPGVPDSHKLEVFEKFYQVSGRKVPGRGVGLGLALSREIAVAHGGAIWVEDNEPSGSIFLLLLAETKMDVAADQLQPTA